MDKPPAGYYRTLLPQQYSHIRLALSNRSMHGVTRQPEASRALANYFDTLSDKYAPYYAAGLRDGSIIAITENPTIDPDYMPGELFFRS